MTSLVRIIDGGLCALFPRIARWHVGVTNPETGAFVPIGSVLFFFRGSAESWVAMERSSAHLFKIVPVVR